MDLADESLRYRDQSQSERRVIESSSRGDAGRPPVLIPARSGGPVLIYAVSGLGKSTLASAHPGRVLDADLFLYEAVANGFPDLEPRARLRAWRDLCRQRPWIGGGEALARWGAVRRAFLEPFVGAMRGRNDLLVVTSLVEPPWVVSAYYGVERGHYLKHLSLVGRAADNQQSEAMNDRLEGYSPLIRMAPGHYLAGRVEIMAFIERSASS